jgi:hypothetical protein
VLGLGVEETEPEESLEPEEEEEEDEEPDEDEEPSSQPPSSPEDDEPSSALDDESYGSLCVPDDVPVLVDDVVVFVTPLASAGSSPS